MLELRKKKMVVFPFVDLSCIFHLYQPTSMYGNQIQTACSNQYRIETGFVYVQTKGFAVGAGYRLNTHTPVFFNKNFIVKNLM